jgi:hypothetical protein
MRQVWECVAVVHSRRAWRSSSGAASASVPLQPEQSGGGGGCRTLYRVRGPSLSSEWDAVVADLKNRVGRKANIWRDVKSAGIAS